MPRPRFLVLVLAMLTIIAVVAVAQRWLHRHSLNAALAGSLRSGNWSQARRYLELGADPHTRSARKTTTLMIAAEAGDTEWMQRLLNAGVPIDAINDSSNSALMWAAGKGQATAVKLLLDRGACVNLEARHDDNPANVAYTAGHKALSEEIKRRQKLTRLLIEIFQTPLGSQAQRHTALRDFIKQGALVNGSDVNSTPMRWTAAIRDLHATRILLKAGADPNAVPPIAATRVYPLEEAVSKGDVAMTNLLLGHGADPSLYSYGMPPLMVASHRGQAGVVEALLKGGANPNQRYEIGTGKGTTEVWVALKFAREGRHEAIVRLLKAAGAK